MIKKIGGRRFLLLIACLVVILAIWGGEVGAKKKEKPKEKKKVEQVEDVVYRFENAEEIVLFKQMYQSKRLINTRMAVLKSYLQMEENNLKAIDAQMYVKFKFTLDPKKQYNLNEEKRLLREVK